MKLGGRAKPWFVATIALALVVATSLYCAQKPASTVMGSGAAKVYVAPGTYDEFYAFMSGGFSGQVSVYGLPSGRLLKVIPVFSQNPENAYGYSEETKPMLKTSYGFIPWDDSHHTEDLADQRYRRWALAVHQRQQHAAHRPPRPVDVRDRRDHRDSERGRQPRFAVHHHEHGVRGVVDPLQRPHSAGGRRRSRITRRNSEGRSPSSRSRTTAR